MSRLADIMRHPSHLMHPSESFIESHKKSTAGGLIVLILAVIGLVWMWPELQRYMRVRRM